MDSGYTTDGYTADITMTVNGELRAVQVDNRMSVLDLLRERFGLTGAKKGCDHGQCGACTVLIGTGLTGTGLTGTGLADGRRVNACLALAVAYDGAGIQTVEGLAGPGGLHPLQGAFLRHDAFQCGYCTPGQIMSAVACVKEGHAENDADIREYMSGNLCRCAAYPNIVDAVKQAKPLMKEA